VLFRSEAERPFGYQLYDNDPLRILDTAKSLTVNSPDFIDINMGCWTRSISGRGAGSGLLKDPGMIKEIVTLLVNNLTVPVTVKIRLGWDSQNLNYLDVGRIIEEAGASLISIHARTRAQGYTGTADWNAITQMKKRIKIPVIANGDIKTIADIDRVIASTHCDAVMIGRAAIGNPWIFKRLSRNDVSNSEVWEVFRDHLNRHISFYDERLGVKLFRKHIKGYLAGRLDASQIQRVLQVSSSSELSFLVQHLLHAAA
jgi:nifR3 family TIM-barrel protein